MKNLRPGNFSWLVALGVLAAGLNLPIVEGATRSEKATAASSRPPNIVLILVDDFGYECIGAYGGTSYRIFSWWSTRDNVPNDKKGKEWAFTRDFKLYTSGEFYDMRTDIEEKNPLKVDALAGEAATGAKLLRGVLDEFAKVKPTQPTFKPIKAVDEREIIPN